MVVARHEVVFVVPGEHGVGGDVILVPADVGSGLHFFSAANRIGDRPLRERMLAVAGSVLRARREDHLIVVVGVHRHVGEAQHRLHSRRLVQDLHRGFEISLAGPQRIADCPAHLMPEFQLAHPDGLAAVGVLFHRVLHGAECAGAVVMRDVPFHAARDPSSDQPDEGGLDHVLPVDEVVVVGFVDALEQTSAEFGQDAQPDVLVFEMDQGVGLIDLPARERIVHRVGIHRALSALRLPTEEEHRVRLGSAGQVGRDDRFLLPHPDPLGIGCIGRRESHSADGTEPGEQDCD